VFHCWSERFLSILFQVDVFEIEAVDLQNVTKVIVGHDGKDVGQGWHLDKVVVSVVDDKQITHSWMFNSQRYALLAICQLTVNAAS
jgi:hypothetical protein